MTENIHNNDDLFRKAYKNAEEAPSAEVWDKLSAQLDKKDAIYYRSRFARWRNIAVILILLLSSFAAYELFVGNAVNKGAGIAGKNVETKQSSKQVTGQQQNASGTDNIKKDVTENSKTGLHKNQIIKQDDFKQSTSHTKQKQSLNTQKIIASNKAGNEAIVDQHAIAFSGKEDSSFRNIEANASDINKPVVTGKENTKATDSSGYIFTALKAGDSLNNPNASADKKTIKFTALFKPHWSFSPYASMGFAGQHLDNDDAFREPNVPDERTEIDKRENHEVSYALGFFARYHVNRSFTVKTGLSYSNMSINIQPQTLHTSATNDYNGYKFVTSSGYAYVPKAFGATPSAGDSIHAETAEHHISYLDIPLMAGYTINPANRLTVTPGAGITTHIFLGSKVETDIKKGDEREHVSLNNFKGQSPVYFSFVADAELNYRVNNKLSLMFVPSFNYAINSITNKNVVKTYPYSLNLGLGLTWSLNN